MVVVVVVAEEIAAAVMSVVAVVMIAVAVASGIVAAGRMRKQRQVQACLEQGIQKKTKKEQTLTAAADEPVAE